MSRPEFLTLEVTDLNNLGCGVARHDGKVVFVKGAVTGDTVRAQIIKENKSFLVGKLSEIVTPSPYRVKSDECTAPLSCGGCVYRHITYEHEKAIKRDYVKNAFAKVGLDDVKVLDTVSTEKTSGYRNKAQFPVCRTKNGLAIGFYATKTHTVIPCATCAIQHPEFCNIANEVCRICNAHGVSAYNEQTGTGVLRHIYLRAGERRGEIMLCLVINAAKLDCGAALADEICERFPNIVSVMTNTNTKNTNVVLGESYTLLKGRNYIEDELCGLRFKITPQSFYQVNRDGAELLYSLAADLAGLKESDGDLTLCDLYCGTGTIGLSMAKHAKRLVGIEIVESAVECAKQNALDNSVTNAEFFCADASDPKTILDCMGGERPDVVVIDPPRKGSTRELAECLAELGVPRIVYVSCNPDTLARDCTYFAELGYKIGEVTPVDMFPRTGHVESVVCLNKKTTHEMKLHASPFKMIKNGTKSIELRLYDEKRQKIKVGDDIVFTNTINGEKLCATVKALHLFDSFEALYKTLPLLQCGYTPEDIDTAHPSDMEEYYSIEEQNKFGVVGIELSPANK